MSVVANESVALECRSQAVPPPVLTWRKDGRPLDPRPGVHLSTDKALLEVCRAGPGGGPYEISSAQLHPPDLVRSCCRGLARSPQSRASRFSPVFYSFFQSLLAFGDGSPSSGLWPNKGRVDEGRGLGTAAWI